jgi:hypothetical protein
LGRTSANLGKDIRPVASGVAGIGDYLIIVNGQLLIVDYRHKVFNYQHKVVNYQHKVFNYWHKVFNYRHKVLNYWHKVLNHLYKVLNYELIAKDFLFLLNGMMNIGKSNSSFIIHISPLKKIRRKFMR